MAAGASGVLTESDTRLVFRHSLIRDALAARVPTGLRTATGSGVTVGWVIDWLVEAGPQLIYRAPAIAADLLAQTVDNFSAADPRQDAATAATPSRSAGAERCRGLVDHNAELLLSAADRYRAIGRPLEDAATLEDAAALLAEAGDAEGARAALTPTELRVAELVAEGGSRRRPAPTTTPTHVGVRSGAGLVGSARPT